MKGLKPALVNSSPAFNCLIKQYAKESIKGCFLRLSDRFNPSGTLCPAVSLPLPNEQLPPPFFAFHETSLALIHQTSTSPCGSGAAGAGGRCREDGSISASPPPHHPWGLGSGRRVAALPFPTPAPGNSSPRFSVPEANLGTVFSWSVPGKARLIYRSPQIPAGARSSHPPRA